MADHTNTARGATVSSSTPSIVAVRKKGNGRQFCMRYSNEAEPQWEAASSVRRQHPQLVEQWDAAHLGDEMSDSISVHTNEPEQQQAAAAAAAAGAVEAQKQLAELRIILVDKEKELLQARAMATQSSPLPSPQSSPQASPPQPPAASPQPSPHASPQRSRFAQKQPSAQDLGEYDGAAGSKLDDWLASLRRTVRLYELNDREAVAYATSRLSGAAQQWWDSLDDATASATSTAAALNKALRARFQPVTAVEAARDQMDALKQGNRHINSYIADFQRLRAIITDMGEAEALHAFRRGLSPSLQVELRRANINKLSDAIDLAARVGSIASAAAAASTPTPRSGATGALNQLAAEDEAEQGMVAVPRSMLNAFHLQAQNNGMGAKTQTQRSYAAEQQQQYGFRGGRNGSSARGGRGGFGNSGRFNRPPPTVPGVAPEEVQRRWDAKLCVRCGDANHISPACPNAISAHPKN
jgi:hypothetical protein